MGYTESCGKTGDGTGTNDAPLARGSVHRTTRLPEEGGASSMRVSFVSIVIATGSRNTARRALLFRPSGSSVVRPHLCGRLRSPDASPHHSDTVFPGRESRLDQCAHQGGHPWSDMTCLVGWWRLMPRRQPPTMPGTLSVAVPTAETCSPLWKSGRRRSGKHSDEWVPIPERKGRSWSSDRIRMVSAFTG